MKIVSFPERTTVYAKNQPEYLQLPSHVFKDSAEGRIACCWRMTWRDRLKILFSGLVWHEILTFGNPLQPQKLSADKPNMPNNG